MKAVVVVFFSSEASLCIHRLTTVSLFSPSLFRIRESSSKDSNPFASFAKSILDGVWMISTFDQLHLFLDLLKVATFV